MNRAEKYGRSCLVIALDIKNAFNFPTIVKSDKVFGYLMRCSMQLYREQKITVFHPQVSYLGVILQVSSSHTNHKYVGVCRGSVDKTYESLFREDTDGIGNPVKTEQPITTWPAHIRIQSPYSKEECWLCNEMSQRDAG